MKIQKIICPNCGSEYLPAEIYLPNEFLGKPKDIYREHMTHKIIDFSGKNMDLNENYYCDFCGVPFTIKAKVSFQTEKNDKYDFTSEYTTNLKKNKLFFTSM